MSEEFKQINFDLFIEKLKKVGVDCDKLVELYGDKIKNASFSVSNEDSNAYDGSLVNTVLRVLTPNAVRLNDILPQNIKVEKNAIVKVCLLSHISKAIRLIPNDNKWEIETRNIKYKFDPNLPSIRTGLHSVVIANECGIPLTASEVEAMTVMDKDAEDKQTKYFSSPLATIIKQANELTYLILRSNQNKK